MATYRLDGAAVTVDTGGTPTDIQSAVTSLEVTAENNYAEHPRTGAAAPYSEIIDRVYEVRIGFAHAFGASGVFTVLNGLAGTEVDWSIETSDGVTSADYPVLTFTGDVPYPDMIPSTEWGEFADGAEITVRVKGAITVTTA